MKILIIGSGGREHAIARKVAQSDLKPTLIFAPGNPGMAQLGQCVPVSAEDIDGLTVLAKKEQPDLTIVGPEAPLVEGLVDKLLSLRLKVFGPRAQAAQLEGSKAFSKEFMARYNIPTAAYQTFTELQPAQDYLTKVGAPIVIKASGLAAGKGAIVCSTLESAREAVDSMLGANPQFGQAGSKVVIEECMQGEEASILAICDGESYTILPSSQDHKRALDNDEGPNTGGMGAYSPAPLVTPELLARVESEVIVPVLQGMKQEGCPFTGVLYAGIMVTSEGPKVVEFNVRLGDPEAQVVLPAYQGDFLKLILASLEGTLTSYPTPQSTGSSAIVILAAGGYPGPYNKGEIINGLDRPLPEGAHIIHAGTKEQDGNIVTNGGRVLGVVGQAGNLKLALAAAYNAVECISFKGMHFRKDIGQKGLNRINNLSA